MRECPDIGSIFPVDTLTPPDGSRQAVAFAHEPHVTYFSLCREIFSIIARSINKPSGKVLLPAYTCQTVITPFTELGWSCSYFGVTSDLRIDIGSLRRAFTSFHPDVLVVHPYYGRDLNLDELSVLHEIKTDGCIFIEDLTQCLFSTQRDSVFDYFVASLRKWFPIPDGAVMFSPKCPLEIDTGNLCENSSFVELELDAMFLRGVYYDSGDVRYKEISRRIDKLAVKNASTDVTPHSMSRYAHAVLANYDIRTAAAKRLRNYKFLMDHVVTPELRKLDIGEVSSAPLYFPVFSTNREAVIQKLIENRIYAPVLWPVRTQSLLINEVISHIFDQILAIPCDQRYGENDLNRVAESLNT